MCTTIAMVNESLYFGRNMDLDFEFGERVVITPRCFPVPIRQDDTLQKHYAFIGMASVAGGFPLYADAVNEFGLCAAGLNFPESAWYSSKLSSSKHNITPYELIPWILGKCTSAQEAKELLKNTNIYGEPFSESIPLTPLHWHFADKTESFVLEVMKDGIHIYDDPACVLTNNPPFGFHMTNLCHYLNLTPDVPENCFTAITGDEPFGKGLGSFGLPGDYSPASRFVKAAYLLRNSPVTDNENDNIAQIMHILDAVSVVKGSITPKKDAEYLTVYSCCIDAARGIYYYKSYRNNQLTGIRLFNEDIDGDSLSEFFLQKNQQIDWVN
ncbi:MAG: choloylglycine hydrolase [Oscillospiraceae bacterium]|nr:choloylglycine hydrolase [Oscillospiraceae bacterium]